MKRKSAEVYSGQRSKEKRELFGRFRLRAIEDIYRAKFFALFGNRCFKCGAKERTHHEVGRPAILCIDHHIPMVLGGHLVPGNLVALCQGCNNKKLDLPPETFYTPGELERLKPLLEREAEIFSFVFDWDAWSENREDYLVSLGVPSEHVRELLFNPEYPDYIGITKDSIGVTIAIDVDDLYEQKNG